MRQRIWFVGILVCVSLGLVAPARAGSGIREDDHVKVVIAGNRIVDLPGSTTTACDTNPARVLACNILLAVSPLKVSLGSEDGTLVLVSLDAHREPYTP